MRGRDMVSGQRRRTSQADVSGGTVQSTVSSPLSLRRTRSARPRDLFVDAKTPERPLRTETEIDFQTSRSRLAR